MGGGGSKRKTEDDEKGSDELREPEEQEIDVESIPEGYPIPKPPPNKKADIFQHEKFKNIDERAKQVSKDRASTYEDLAGLITADSKTDVEKLRAIFIWVGAQKISTTKFTGPDANNPNTPVGAMRLLKERKLAYPSFFALLCRAAKLPCVIVHGVAKSVGYEIGMDDSKIKHLHNSWNAVYVAAGWRFVFPLWAFSGIAGHSSGKYTKIEEKGKAVREKEVESEGFMVSHVNEFYFLPDPEEFKFVAYPNDPKWLLLPKEFSFKDFGDVPLCRKAYFDNGIEIKSKFSCRYHTKDGQCQIEFKTPENKDIQLDYELYYNNAESGRDISNKLQLNNFVFVNRQKTKWNFGIRFPEAGIYKLEIIGGQGSWSQDDICSFRIICDEAKVNCQPLPVNPGRIGYGPSLETEKAGLKAVSHPNGFVNLHIHQEQQFIFKMIRKIEVKAELVNSSLSQEESVRLQKHVTQKIQKTNLEVNVNISQNGEYALRLYTKEKKSMGDYKNACNYLLGTDDPSKRRKRLRENPTEKNVRQNLKDKTNLKSIEDLESAIDKFRKHELEDKGDLSKALERLQILREQKELHDAIKRRHLETLEKAITVGKSSPFAKEHQSLLEEAEEVKQQLASLNRFAHDVLAMKQSTIAELKSYKIPPPVIHDVMKATYLMLGEKPEDIQDWEDLRHLIHKTEPDMALLRRVRKFDTVPMRQETLPAVREIIDRHNEAEVRLASAGAGTFYVWLKNVLGTIPGGN